MTTAFYVGPVRTVWRLFGPRRRELTVGIAFRFAQALFQAVPAVALVWVIDLVRRDALTATQAWIATGLVLAGAAGQYVTGYVSNRIAWTTTFLAVGDARERALERLHRLPLGSLQSRGTGDLATVLTADFEAVSMFAHHGLPQIFGAVGLPLFVLLGLLVVDPPMAGAVAVSVVVAVPLFRWANRMFVGLALERGDALADAGSRMVEFVQGIGVVRAFDRSGDRLGHFRTAVGEIKRVNDGLAVKLVPLAFLAMGVVQLGVPLVVAGLSYWLVGGRIDAGVALVFLVLVLRVYAPLIQVATSVEELRLSDAALHRIGRVMDLQPQPAPDSPRHEPRGHGVAFEGVGFGYDPDRPVLHDVAFTAAPGTATAIVGPSGAGKSTILHLVARFWDPGAGRVTIGGVDVRELTPTQLFDAVTVVFQDVYLFQGSVRDNIAFGRPDASATDIEAAARAAQIHDVVTALPQGYDTPVGEGGSALSGGERQRVSIARALLKDSPVVLLDEATAAIDPIGERAVQAALAELVRGRTLIVVAHRMSTIRSADQILAVEGGRIVQRGRHDQLLSDPDGLYARLWSERERASRWRVAARP